MIASLRTHTDAIVAKIEAQGLVTGDATDPDTAFGWQSTPGQSQFIPYVIVYPLLGGTFDGSLGCPDDDAELLWQATCVGSTRTQCEWVLDEVNDALVGQIVVVDSRAVKRISADVLGGARRDDTVQPPTFIATPRYRALSVPSV